MSVDPLKSRAVPSADAARVAGGEQVRRSEAPSEERSGEATQVSSDSVELSAASRRLLSRADDTAAVPQGTLSAERIHAVLRRLAEGFYDGAEVRTEIARRVATDIGNSRPE
jgi:hypothetical protein